MSLTKDIKCKTSSRCLSIVESFHQKMMENEEPMFMMFNVSMLSSVQAIDEDSVRQSFSTLARQHPLLESTISQDLKGDYYFSSLIEEDQRKVGKNDSIEIKETLKSHMKVNLKTLKIENKKEWIPIVYNEVKIPFVKGEPLWKACWLILPTSESEGVRKYHYILLFICHHAILDGKGAFDLIANQFLPILQSHITGKLDLRFKNNEKFLPKSFEEIFFDFTCSVSEVQLNWVIEKLSDFAMWVFEKVGKKAVERVPMLKTFDKYQKDQDASKYHTFNIGKSLTESFFKLCKEGKVSVHSFLVVVFSTAIEETRIEFTECKESLCKMFYPIDMRKFYRELSSSPMPIGTFFSSGWYNFKPVRISESQSKFVAVAQSVYKSVQKSNTLNQPGELFKLLVPLIQNSPQRSTLDKIMGFLRSDKSCSLSNIGNCDLLLKSNEQSHLIILDEYYFSLTLPGGPMLTISTLNGQMFFTIVCNGHWIDESFMKLFESNFIKTLEYLCNKNVPTVM